MKTQEVQYIVAITVEADINLTEKQLRDKFSKIRIIDIQGNQLEGTVKVIHVKEEAEIYETENAKRCYIGTDDEVKNLDFLADSSKLNLPKRI